MIVSLHALVPAAGRGLRFRGDVPKQLLPIGGRPLLGWTVARLLECGVESLVVALPGEFLDEGRGLLPAGDPRVRCVAGGEHRQDSVALCVVASPATAADLVLVHDGARPAVAVADVATVVEAARRHGAAILGRPLGDTVKRVNAGRIITTVPRDDLFRAETPQVFRREILDLALAAARRDGFLGTDEASLVERLPGVTIAAVPASHPNPKLTVPSDLALIEPLLIERG